jgi:toxin ParE1/3/4
MSNICRFTVPASRDIESIIDYVAGNSSLGAAERLLKKINQKCTTLAHFPSRCQTVRDRVEFESPD